MANASCVTKGSTGWIAARRVTQLIAHGTTLGALSLSLLTQGTASAAEPAVTCPKRNDTNSPLLTLLKSRHYAELDAQLATLQRNYEAGRVPEEGLYQGFRQLYQDTAANKIYFDEWVQTFPQSYAARLARGTYYYRMAWFVRGGDYISNTPAVNVLAMESYLSKAQPDLRSSLRLTDKPYLSTLYLLNVAEMEGTDEERRYWLEQGNQIDPANKRLRIRYMVSLEPRWGGSYQAMDAFLAESAQQKVADATLAELRIVRDEDMGNDENWRDQTTPAQRYQLWSEVIELSPATGRSPSMQAIMGRTRAAWDLHKRDEADTGLAQLATMSVNEAWALSEIGYIYAQEHRDTLAWPPLLRAAQMGDSWAQMTVGETIYQGCPELGLKPDPAAGLLWLRRAAAQNQPAAKEFLRTHTPPTSIFDQVTAMLGF